MKSSVAHSSLGAPPTVESYSSVLARIGISRPTLWRWLRDESNDFPRPVRLGKRKLGFVVAEVDSWVLARGTASGAQK